MTELRYPLSALFWDYARGVAGMVLCFVILVTIEWQNQLVWLFAGLTVLFAVYTMMTIAKNLTRFRVTEEGIACGGFRKKMIRWAELGDLSLRYYPTSRNRKKGWMSLALKGGAAAEGGSPASARDKIQIDSNLPGFAEICARAAHAARENRLTLDRITTDNMTAIGVAGGAPGGAPGIISG